jgi:hypothetical protein
VPKPEQIGCFVVEVVEVPNAQSELFLISPPGFIYSFALCLGSPLEKEADFQK